MKGDDKFIEVLNFLLADELTAVSQYMVHAEMCANWGYAKLAEVIEKRAIDEMKHAEKHISRILFLEGRPIVSSLNQMHIEADVASQFKSDHNAEEGAIKAYNDSIQLCAELHDAGTRDLLGDILKDEEAHIDWLETQLDQISQIGIENFLAANIKA